MKLVRHNLNLVMQSTASRKRDRNGFVYESALQAKKTWRSCGGTPLPASKRSMNCQLGLWANGVRRTAKLSLQPPYVIRCASRRATQDGDEAMRQQEVLVS